MTEAKILNQIHINQVGYAPTDPKIAVVVIKDAKLADQFEIVDEATGKSIFTSLITPHEWATSSGLFWDSDSGDHICYADFTAFETTGTYHIRIEGCENSYPFTVESGILLEVADATLKALYSLRCGVALEEIHIGPYQHGICHDRLATVYNDPNKKIDVTGGWHDAGDYGKYAAPGAVSVGHLLLAYEFFPQGFHDQLNIPESGNGIADILDEARYELEFLLKCVDAPTGGVYHKITTLNFPGFVMPEDDLGELFAMPVSPTATATCCAVFAQAARIYAEIDSEFAKKCLAAMKLTWEWLVANPKAPGFKNPSDVLTGEYGDVKSTDERYWAAVECYRLTNDQKYLPYIEDLLEVNDDTALDLGWQSVAGFGVIGFLLKTDEHETALYRNTSECLVENIEKLLEKIKGNGYFNALDDYPWGSNGTVMNQSMMLLMAGLLKKKDAWILESRKICDYLLGTNPLGISYITGFGSHQVMNPHHRPSGADKIKEPVPGMVIGGPCAGRLDEDTVKFIPADVPQAKAFTDTIGSYSTNEITIYWNSPAILPLTYFARSDWKVKC